ncbi:FAD-binding protein [Bacillus mangrovi]|uniref:FAD-binding protein n=1 Tax=Metabacillus mangrovi TaxID=1491830 RepID=A0A7X2S4M4_9BACI|nr:NAD(P)/FAD-dependent oxidoreductase [Metabacillus mangrovi]MTH53420.1 FAD-binding protein [Metabacillus mangrovi]
MSDKNLDVTIIGGGAAGLNAALVLGRARRKVLVIDEERPRNRVTRESHGFLTQDGISPSEFRRTAKEQILKYPSVSFVSGIVDGVTGVDGDFRVHTGSGDAFRSRKVLFATGMKDVVPDIEGLAEVYGTSAFVCPFCDGWELRDKKVCVIGTNEKVFHLVKVLTGWTKHITLLTNGMDILTADQLLELEQHQVPANQDTIKCIESVNGFVKKITLRTDEAIECEGIFFTPNLVQATSIPESLGCKMTNDGPFAAIAADQMGRTNVKGIFSAGDASTTFHQLIYAASSGAIAAVTIQLELNEEEWDGFRK